MPKMDKKQAQQNCTPSHSSVTNIQRTLYIILATLSLFFTIISVIHFLINDKTTQTIIQILAYILGIAIGIILFLIAHNQSKTNHSSGIIMIIFLYFTIPAYLIGIAYFSKIPMDAGAALGYLIPLVYAFYEKLSKSKENDIQENTSPPSSAFVQKKFPTSIQNNSPISIQNNNNSPISIQNNINTIHNVTNVIDEQSERERITNNAYKMLNSKDLTSRISAVKTLANMADSWLEDSPNCKKDEKKCQDIIDILCVYIRSPFPLAEKIEEYEAHKELEKLQKTESEKLSEEEYSRLQILLKRFENSDEYEKPKDITTDYAKFHEEQDVRRTIFVEMSKRSSALTKDENNNIFKAKPGKWSHFQFDFSRAPIFYPLNNLKIEKGNFSSAKFYSDASFSWAAFTQTADFKSATFAQKADFKFAVFVQIADFKSATFAQKADFMGAIFTQGAIFSWATFTQTADFRSAVFTQSALFSWATFTQTADFMRATFTQTADFMRATFTQTAKFKSATFTQTANFCGATFSSDVDFRWATFKRFEPTFTTKLRKAQFSIQTAQKDYKFSVHPDSKPIRLGKAELDGIKRQIPVGAVLFDPDSDRKSKPAK